MRASNELQALIARIAPYWGAEAEVIRTYFDGLARSRAGDLDWIGRQCRKEFWDSFDGHQGGLFDGPMKRLVEASAAERIDRGFDRHEVLDLAEGAFQEFAHYVAFADAYDAIRAEGDPPIDPYRLRDLASWPENDALSDLRARHRVEHGALGPRASRLTEGGYCGLFSEGMRLKGRSPADDAIAHACALVYDDEFDHMLKGIAGLDRAGLARGDWQVLGGLAVDQMKLRLAMRNAQFGRAVAENRLAEIAAGAGTPVAFDWKRAGFDG
jgi:hypothetical protein